MAAGQHMGEVLQSNPGQQRHQTDEENLSEDRMRCRLPPPHLNTDFLYFDFVRLFLKLHTKFPVDVCVCECAGMPHSAPDGGRVC